MSQAEVIGAYGYRCAGSSTCSPASAPARSACSTMAVQAASSMGLVDVEQQLRGKLGVLVYVEQDQVGIVYLKVDDHAVISAPAQAARTPSPRPQRGRTRGDRCPARQCTRHARGRLLVS
jgi:hypothetical protein